MDDLMDPLPAITLHPWWAWAILHGGKLTEYRSRPFPKALTNEWVALHAGRQPHRLPKASDLFEGEETMPSEMAEAARLKAPVMDWLRDRFAGGVLGSAVVGLVRFSDVLAPDQLGEPWRSMGKVGWWVREFVALPRPVKTMGQQGFWRLNDIEREEVVQQFIEVRRKREVAGG